MAQILIKGENVYKCDACSRKIRVLESRDGIDVVQRCTITYGCRGKLLRVRDTKEINNTPAFPEEVPGVQDWFQRRVVYTHTQPIKASRWIIKHNLSNKPIVYAYQSRQLEGTPTYSMTVVPAVGTMWYKSESGYDYNNPLNPTSAGLYMFNGSQWVNPPDVILGGMIGSNTYEYLELIEPTDVNIIDANTIELIFNENESTQPRPISGMAQCVALASQNTANPNIQRVTDISVPFQLSNNGEITIATAVASVVINVTINFKSSVVPGGITVTFNSVDNTPSVASPWVSTSKVFINGKTYTVRSFNISRTPPVPGIMASGSVDPSMARFTFEGMSPTVNENLILLGTPPFSTVDRVYDRVIDISQLNKFNPEIYYNSGEIYASQNKIQSVHPPIHIVD